MCLRAVAIQARHIGGVAGTSAREPLLPAAREQRDARGARRDPRGVGDRARPYFFFPLVGMVSVR